MAGRGGSDRLEMAARLKEAREYLGLSQEDVARVLKIARPAESTIESGERRVEAMELSTLAKLYGHSQEYFTSGREDAAESETFGHLQRSLKGLSESDLSEVARFAQFLKSAGRKPGRGNR
jgi:transcriptional regulator with XRE-family HTH domain